MAHGIWLGNPPIQHSLSSKFWFQDGDILLSSAGGSRRLAFRVHHTRLFATSSESSHLPRTNDGLPLMACNIPHELIVIALQCIYQDQSPSLTLSDLDQLLTFCAQQALHPVRKLIIKRFESQIGTTLLQFDYHDIRLERSTRAASQSSPVSVSSIGSNSGDIQTYDPASAIAIARRHNIFTMLPTFYYNLFRARPKDPYVDWSQVTTRDTQIIAQWELYHNSVIQTLRSLGSACLRQGHDLCTNIRSQIYQKIAASADRSGDILRPLRCYASGESLRRHKVCPECTVDTCLELHRQRFAVWMTLNRIVSAS